MRRPQNSDQFRYLRDGQWINDGQADAYVHNRLGSDSFVVITDPKFKPHHGGMKEEGHRSSAFVPHRFVLCEISVIVGSANVTEM